MHHLSFLIMPAKARNPIENFANEREEIEAEKARIAAETCKFQVKLTKHFWSTISIANRGSAILASMSHRQRCEIKASKKVECVRRYKKSSRKKELTADAKGFICRWLILMPYVMYAKLMLVTLPRKLYDHLRIILTERKYGPEGDVMFCHVPFRNVDMEKFRKNNPQRSPHRHGELFSNPKSALAAVINPIGNERGVYFVDWTLAISPFSPIPITSVLVKCDIMKHGDNRSGADWVLYLQAFDYVHVASGKRFPELSKNHLVYHFYDSKVAYWFAEGMLPDLD